MYIRENSNYILERYRFIGWADMTIPDFLQFEESTKEEFNVAIKMAEECYKDEALLERCHMLQVLESIAEASMFYATRYFRNDGYMFVISKWISGIYIYKKIINIEEIKVTIIK